MAEGATRTGCPECDAYRARLAQYQARIAELESQLATAGKHSGNSSKPPSSDIVKPPPKDRRKPGRKRRRGGQRGHPQHTRPAFPPDQLDTTQDYTLDGCPACGGPLTPAEAPPRVVQQVEIETQPLRITEHRGRAYWCARCRCLHYAPLPQAVAKAGLVGPRLTALVGFLKGACHASFATIRKFIRDVLGVTISRGHLAKVVAKVSASLETTYDALLAALPEATRLNVDETGHPDQGLRLWTWCFRAPQYTVFCIDPSRGADVLVRVLGEEFNGVLGCDYFSAYRKYMKDFNVAVQFCLAHLIRDVKFLVTHPRPANQRYGQRLLEHLRKLFGIIHRREYYASPGHFQQALAAARNALLDDAFLHLARTREAHNLAARFWEHGDSYFRFITEPDVAPTNNLAEQAIRFVAIHRRLTQGTRGTAGQRWCERIWTVVTTCGQQGRSVFDFLCEAVQAHFQGAAPPGLLPDTT